MNPEISTTGAPRQTTAREFLSILFRRRGLVIGLFVVTTITVVAISLSTATSYLSTARVLVKRGEKDSALMAERRLYDAWEEEMGSEVEVVKSQPVLDRARELLREDSPSGKPSIVLDGKGLDAEVRGRTNVILIGYSDRDPVKARIACDAVSRAYVEYRQNNFSMSKPHNFFEGEIDKVQHDLDYWIGVRRDYAERKNVISIPDQRAADLTRLNALRLRQSEYQSDYTQAQMATGKLVELQAAGAVDQPSFSVNMPNESGLIELKRRVVDQEVRVASLRERLQPEAPEMLAAAVTLDTLRNLMNREIAMRIQASRAQEDLLGARLKIVNDEIADLESGLAAMPDKEVTMMEMQHRIDVLQSRYKDLIEGREKLNITENTSRNRSVVLLTGASNATPQNQRDYVRLALGPAFSLIVGIGLAFFFDGLDLTVRTARQAEEAIEVPVLASLTERTRRRRRGRGLSPEAAA